MAVYHFNAAIVKRSEGHSAVAGAAYISASTMYEERTGIMHDYSRKRGVVHAEILAPGTANPWMYDRSALWNQVELGEKRSDAQLARSIKLALPHELTDEQRADLVFRYTQDMFVSRGMIADVSIHRPDRHGDSRNHHAHILLTMREIDGDGFSKKKQRAWNDDALLEHWREEWANYQNHALEGAGSDARVDHRTLEAQGIEREPTRHMGKDASAMERKGKRSRIGDENREIEARNQQLDALVSEYTATEAQIQRELEREFLRSGLEQQPESENLQWEQEGVKGGREEREHVLESLQVQEEAQADPSSAFTSPVVQAYREHGTDMSRPPQAAPETRDAAPVDPSSAFTSSITRAYREYVETPEEEQEKAERRWYEEWYHRTVETVRQYWGKFVDKIVSWREEQDHEIEGPDR